MLKWIIINSLGEETRKIIEGQGKTAFPNMENLRTFLHKKSRTKKIKNIK